MRFFGTRENDEENFENRPFLRVFTDHFFSKVKIVPTFFSKARAGFRLAGGGNRLHASRAACRRSGPNARATAARGVSEKELATLSSMAMPFLGYFFA